MVDPLTLVTAGGATAYLLKPHFDKILGPTSDYLGTKVQELVKHRIENVNSILEKTEIKLGDRIEDPGSLSPRLVERLINSGSYIDDELTQEYFAGVLATSRSISGKDDRGLYFLDIIGKLSHSDLKVHYIFYSQLRKKHLGTQSSIFIVDHRHSLYNRMTLDRFFSEFQQYYDDSFDKELILTEAASRLLKEDLLNEILFGPRDFIDNRAKALFGYRFIKDLATHNPFPNESIKMFNHLEAESFITTNKDNNFSTMYKAVENIFLVNSERKVTASELVWRNFTRLEDSGEINSSGIELLYTPSPLGAQLFLWAHGEGHRLANDVFNPNLNITSKNQKNEQS